MRRSSPPKARREKKCRVCRESFRPFTSTQIVCGIKCSLIWGRQQVEKATRKKQRCDIERIKPLSRVMHDTQVAFNMFIRLRDEGQPCISCDEINPPGGWDSGHYRTLGAAPELRFEELNAHRQCKSCNGGAGRFSGKGYTVIRAYRERLIVRIGLAAVEWLEGPHEAKRYRADELREIKAEYRRRSRELRKQRK